MSKAMLIGLGVLLVCFSAAAPAHAQMPQPGTWTYYPPIPQAPDARGPGYYAQNYCGGWYGPNQYVYPPFPPFNGMVFPPCQSAMGNAQWRFPSHPFARGPRDFFMYEAK